jgi:cell wall-associated NlpC family hydrolase
MLPSWAGDYVGLPYVEQGRDRIGCDCWGLVALVQREVFDREVPAYEALTWPHGSPRSVTEAIGAFARAEAAVTYDKVYGGTEVEGDIVLLRMRGQPLHVGVVLGGGMMLHTDETEGSCIETYKGMMFGNRVLGFYRVRG